MIASVIASQPFEAEATSLFSAMSPVPDSTRKVLVNDTIRRLKAAGLWAKRDLIYMLAAHSQASAYRNWKNPSTYTLSASGSITATADKALVGDGTTGALSTGFVPGTAAGQFARDSANVKLYGRTFAFDANEGYDFGVLNTYFRLGKATGGVETRLNASTGDQDLTQKVATEWWEIDRSAAESYDLRRNAVTIATRVRNSQSLTTTDAFSIFQRTGLGTNFSSRPLAAVLVGSHLTTTESAAENDILNSYLRQLGAAGTMALANDDDIYVPGGQSFYVLKCEPELPHSIRALGGDEYEFVVNNGEMAASTTRDRSEIVGNDLYAWGSDLWFGFERKVIHYAENVHDSILGQIHDWPNSGLGPPFHIAINPSRQEVVLVSYKYASGADQNITTVIRDPFEPAQWIEWIVHFKTGLSVGYGETGRVEVWRSGVKVIDYTGDVGYEEYRGQFKLQLGIYSEGTTGTPGYDDGNDSERRVRYRKIRIGTIPLM